MSVHENEPLQTVIQINVYRFKNGQFEYLLLKRIDEDDKFWMPVTEVIPSHGTIAETLRRAADEQLGVRGFRHLSQEMYSYEWYSHDQRGRDIVFTAELGPDTQVTFDKHRFSTSAWLPFTEAVERLKWNGNKEALRQLHKRLIDKYNEHPEIFTQPNVPHPTSAPASLAGTISTPLQAPGQPAGNGQTATGQVAGADRQVYHPPSKAGPQKRLPDRPEPAPQQTGTETNIGEWFL